MNNKILAIFGIGTYVLSVLSSATDLEGNSVAPSSLVAIAGIATAVFIIMATIRLYKQARGVAVTLVSSAVILFILSILLSVISPSYGSLVIVLLNIAKVVNLIAFVWAVIKLFKISIDKTSEIYDEEDLADMEKIFEMSKDLSPEIKAEEQLEINPKRTGNFWEYSKTMGREEALDVYNMWLLHVRYYHPKLDVLFKGVTIPTFFLPVPMELLQEVPGIIKEYKNKEGIYENEESIENNIGKYAGRYYPRTGSDEEIMRGLYESLKQEETFELLMSNLKKNKDDWYFEYKEV